MGFSENQPDLVITAEELLVAFSMVAEVSNKHSDNTKIGIPFILSGVIDTLTDVDREIAVSRLSERGLVTAFAGDVELHKNLYGVVIGIMTTRTVINFRSSHICCCWCISPDYSVFIISPSDVFTGVELGVFVVDKFSDTKVILNALTEEMFADYDVNISIDSLLTKLDERALEIISKPDFGMHISRATGELVYFLEGGEYDRKGVVVISGVDSSHVTPAVVPLSEVLDVMQGAVIAEWNAVKESLGRG